MDVYDRLVGRIYDCAANPELWPSTLDGLRETVDAAYVLVGFADFSPTEHGGAPTLLERHSPWDEAWIAALSKRFKEIPGSDALYGSEIDHAWTQMGQIREAEFEATPFYQEWVKPQSLRDCLATQFVKRPSIFGVISVAGAAKRPLFGKSECLLVEKLSPHIRRAMAINDMADKGRLAQSLYRDVLDSLSVAVFIVGPGRRMAFANAAAEALLSAGDLVGLADGALAAAREGDGAAALGAAIDRAAKGDKSLGMAGIGVPLLSLAGERAAAYVLPIGGGDLRGAIGSGHAAVFIARRGEQLPMAIEILRTVFDLTQAEARVALKLVEGEAPAAIAKALGLSVSTVRSHLAGAFEKTGAEGQTGLVVLVNRLIPPVAAG